MNNKRQNIEELVKKTLENAGFLKKGSGLKRFIATDEGGYDVDKDADISNFNVIIVFNDDATKPIIKKVEKIIKEIRFDEILEETDVVRNENFVAGQPISYYTLKSGNAGK